MDILKVRKNSYKIIKYTKENPLVYYLDIKNIKENFAYQGNPTNDLTVFLGYLREKSNFTNEEIKILENNYQIDTNIIKGTIQEFQRILINFILNKENKSNNESIDKDISDIVETKTDQGSKIVKIDKDLFNDYVNDILETGYYFNEEGKQNTIKLIKKNDLINFWGKFYTLFFEDYQDFENMLILQNYIKFREKYIYIDNKDRIDKIIKENIQGKSDIEKEVIINLLEKQKKEKVYYVLDNIEYYEKV